KSNPRDTPSQTHILTLNPLMDIIRPMLISGTAFLRLRTNR
ncbi:erythromycin resistance leader peptide, partial [Bifidobacterium bifidum]